MMKKRKFLNRGNKEGLSSPYDIKRLYAARKTNNCVEKIEAVMLEILNHF